ncbi:electron transport complex subunit E [Lachnospiraceae bacterium 54-53]
MNNKWTERLWNGMVKENPTFVLMLGMCPTLAVTTSAVNGAGMGLSTTVVLLFSNMIISALRKIIPDRVRIPAYIVIVATLVTIVQLLLQAYVPGLYSALGIYIPLIVVNCIILGRAESYASKNGVMESTFDGIGMGLGFTAALTCIGLVRELLGAGAIFGRTIVPEDYHISIFILAPGAFFVLAVLTALQNKFKAPSASNGSASKSQPACGGNCAACTGEAKKAADSDAADSGKDE